MHFIITASQLLSSLNMLIIFSLESVFEMHYVFMHIPTARFLGEVISMFLFKCVKMVSNIKAELR